MAFSLQILINSIDYYPQLTGEIVVGMEEGAARTANFTLDPLPGPIDPYAWIGQPVSVYFVDGAPALLFTGAVHTADYDIDAGTTQFVCTDGLQETFETIARPAVDALIPAGLWSDKIFRSTRDNWDYAQQKMSTYPGSLDKSPAGALRVTAWAAKASPDFTYTAATIDSGSLRIDRLAERRSIINSIVIKYTSVFQALRQRDENVPWAADFDGTSNWYNYLAHPFELPERETIESALSDWTIKTIDYTPVPASGIYSGSGPDIVWTHNSYSDALCIGFTAVMALRWRQDIAAEYTITVANAASIAQHGLLEDRASYTASHKTGGRADDFQQFDDYKAPEGDQIYTDANTTEWLQPTQGDDALPQLVAVNAAKTKILQSHRQNRIAFDCALNPALDVDATIRVEHAKLTAQGKIFSIEHKIDVLSGFAGTHCVLSITLPSVAGQSDATISRGTMPYSTSPLDFSPDGAPPAFPALGQHLGNDDGAPVNDDTWNGWISNYDSWTGVGDPPPVYEKRFAVTTPEIDADDFNAWLNDTYELQTKLIKSGGIYYQRVFFGNEIITAGDSVMLYDGGTPIDTHIVTLPDLNIGWYQIAATATRQDEHALTHAIDASFNVALPVEILSISK